MSHSRSGNPARGAWTILSLLLAIVTLVAFGSRTAAAQTYSGKIGTGVSLSHFQFVDFGKCLRAFADLSGTTLTGSQIDASGWPNQDCQSVLWDYRPVAAWLGETSIDDPQKYSPDLSGTWNCSFSGQANVGVYAGGVRASFSVSAVVYDPGTNTSIFTVTVPTVTDQTQRNALVILSFTNTRKTPASALNTGIANLKVIRPGYPANSTQLLDNTFLNTIAYGGFSTIRYMGFFASNDENVTYPAVTTWSQRKLPSDATQDKWGGKWDSGCWEYAVAIANATNTNMWINVPVSANTDYVTKLAQLIKYGSDGVNPYTSTQANPVWPPLESGLVVYLESSNEVWNGIFPQYNWNSAQASASGLTIQKNHARRTVELSNIFKDVYGAAAINTTIRPVLCWHIGFSQTEYNDMLSYINTTFGPPSTLIFGIGGASYFNASGATATATPTQILAAMQTSQDGGIAARNQLQGYANTWGIRQLAYEGGPDNGGGSTTNVANRITANRYFGMRDLILRDLRDNWFPLGCDLFMHLEVAGLYSRYGCWGLTDDYTLPDRNYKFQAQRELVGLASPPAPQVNAVTAPSATQGKRPGQIAVKWTQSTTANVVANHIYRSTTAGGPYKLVKIVVPSTSYTDTGLVSGTTYYYVITALTAGSESANSAQVSAVAR